MPILKVTGLSKSYRTGFLLSKQQVLKEISFSIYPGKVTGFLGLNGVGKTTTLKCLLGLCYPDSGEIDFFNGMGWATPQVKRRIGFLPERPYFYDYLTGMEFLKFYGRLSQKYTNKILNERIIYLLKKVDLYHSKDKRLREYSKGMLQKVGLAQALIHEPEFVILDEPLAGLDPDGRGYLRELIKGTAESGAAVFFSSHLLNDVESLCDDLVILANGHVKYQGPVDQLLSNLDYTSQITYYKKGSSVVETLSSHSLEETQKDLDKIMKAHGSVIEVRKDGLSLERAFVDLTMRKGS